MAGGILSIQAFGIVVGIRQSRMGNERKTSSPSESSSDQKDIWKGME